MPGPRKKNKNASYFSHEFITTNHGDIVSCICMLFMVGLMFKTTQKVAGVFIAPQHNITKTSNVPYGWVGNSTDFDIGKPHTEENDKFHDKMSNPVGSPDTPSWGKPLTDSSDSEVTLYAVGRKDICTIFFYSLAWIVVHAIIQEYLLDKINRRFHLSKTKISRFNNLGGHIPFYFASAAWGADIIMKEELLPKISNIWDGYPHTEMSFFVKFYFILQIAYWVHCFPELYFLKAKKEEIMPRVIVYLQYLAFIVPAYCFNFTYLGLVCLVVHYFVEFCFNAMKILNYMGKTEASKNSLMFLWAGLYAVARIAIIILSIVTFWIGLPKQDSADNQELVPNFNMKSLRITFLVAIIAMQAWLAWLFISYQVSYWSDIMQSKRQKSAKKKEQKKKGKKEEQKKVTDDEHESPLLNGKQKTS